MFRAAGISIIAASCTDGAVEIQRCIPEKKRKQQESPSLGCKYVQESFRWAGNAAVGCFRPGFLIPWDGPRRVLDACFLQAISSFFSCRDTGEKFAAVLVSFRVFHRLVARRRRFGSIGRRLLPITYGRNVCVAGDLWTFWGGGGGGGFMGRTRMGFRRCARGALFIARSFP